jgi:(2Fe-2S) ferredoxin
MKTETGELKAHLFICTHRREDRDSCGPHGGEELVDDLKKWVKQEGHKRELKVSRSGCLGRCDEGVVAVCYPQGDWYTKLKAKDAGELRAELEKVLR